MLNAERATDSGAAPGGRARGAVRRTRSAVPTTPADNEPVATVAVDLPLAHLDRQFDYLVPATMDAAAVPGSRVKVRFAGRDVGGFLVARADQSTHEGPLAPLRRVVSAEPVLTPDVLQVARLVADRYAGTLADVLRLAIPPRHAKVESESPVVRPEVQVTSVPELSSIWSAERSGPAWTERLSGGDRPHAVWNAPAGSDWASRLAASALATRASGRGSLLLAPDAKDVALLDAAVTELAGAGTHVVLTADLGPAARYRAFLAVLRGQVDIVIGTRAAAFAPVSNLGLIAIWDDGDDNYAEQRAPYPHAREIALTRAYHQRAAMLIAGYARTVEAQALLESRWAEELTVQRQVVREVSPQVHITGETDADLARDPAARAARMPAQVFRTVREALADGPVLVHSPRFGYQPTLVCAACRIQARCVVCLTRLSRSAADRAPQCRLCGAVADPWSCQNCGGRVLRAPVVGSLRTAEEWGRSFPQTPVVASGGDHVVAGVDDTPAIVVATPGAEPLAAGGYAAAVLLDTWLTLGMPGLRADEEALRRWLTVAALVRAGSDGGRVIAVGEPTHPALRALVRWDPGGFAERELADRRSARLTPATRMATLTAPPEELTQALAAIDLPRGAEVLGPVDIGEGRSRALLRIEAARGAALSRALQHLQAARTARKLPSLRVEVDPTAL